MDKGYEFLLINDDPIEIAVNIHLVSRVEKGKYPDGTPSYSCFCDGDWVPMSEEGYNLFKERVCR